VPKGIQEEIDVVRLKTKRPGLDSPVFLVSCYSVIRKGVRNRFPRRREGDYETEYIPRRVEREMISRRSSSERPPQIP
jgi:hypothetical protein